MRTANTCLWIGLNFEPIVAQMTLHSKAPYLTAEVLAGLLLLCIEANTLRDVSVTASTPYIERHLKTHNQYTLV